MDVGALDPSSDQQTQIDNTIQHRAHVGVCHCHSRHCESLFNYKIICYVVTGRRFVNTRFVWEKVRKRGFVSKGSYGIKFVWYKVRNGYSS